MDQIMQMDHLYEISYLLPELTTWIKYCAYVIYARSHICYEVSYCYNISNKYVLIINIWIFVITTERIHFFITAIMIHRQALKSRYVVLSHRHVTFDVLSAIRAHSMNIAYGLFM